MINIDNYIFGQGMSTFTFNNNKYVLKPVFSHPSCEGCFERFS